MTNFPQELLKAEKERLEIAYKKHRSNIEKEDILKVIKNQYEPAIKALDNLTSSSRIMSRLNECLEQKQKIADEVAAWWEQQFDDTVILSEEMEWVKREAEVKAQIQLIRHLLDDS